MTHLYLVNEQRPFEDYQINQDQQRKVRAHGRDIAEGCEFIKRNVMNKNVGERHVNHIHNKAIHHHDENRSRPQALDVFVLFFSCEMQIIIRERNGKPVERKVRTAGVSPGFRLTSPLSIAT